MALIIIELALIEETASWQPRYPSEFLLRDVMVPSGSDH
jgi:hypothetical protein